MHTSTRQEFPISPALRRRFRHGMNVLISVRGVVARTLVWSGRANTGAATSIAGGGIEAQIWKLVIALLCVLLAVASAQKAAQQPHQAEKKKSPLVGNYWTKRSKVRASVGAMRHRYHYDAMHINGKPFVTCNHPAFKFGCAHMTYPRTFMNQHHKLIMGAQIEHKNEPISHVAKMPFYSSLCNKAGPLSDRHIEANLWVTKVQE